MIQERAPSPFRLPEIDPTPVVFPQSKAPSPEEPFDSALEGLLQVAKQFIIQRCYAWRVNNDFNFDLPPSTFDEKRNRPLIEFVRHEQVEEELEVRPLSEEQLATIREDGTFIVNSRRYPVPYKWQLTEWLYKGKQRTYQSLLRNLGTCFSMLYYTGQFVVGKQYLSMRERGFHSIYYIWRLLRLFVGIRSTYEQERVSSEYLIEIERHHRLFQTVWQNMERELFEYLRINSDMTDSQRNEQQQRVKQLKALSEDFKTQWRTMIAMDTDVLLQRFNSDELKEVLKKQCQELYQRVVRSKIEIPRKILDNIESLIEDVLTIRKYENEKAESIYAGSNAASKEIKEKYPIRSQSQTWFSKMYDKAVKLLTEAFEENMFAELKRRVRSAAFPLYLEHVDHYDVRIKELKELVTENKPTRTFSLSFPLCPPYAVDYNPESQVYRLIKTKEIDISTGSELWRIKLYCVRYYTWLRNILFYAFCNMIVGPFGLYVLLRCYDFYPDSIINSTTGQVGRDPQSKQTPIAASLRDTAMSVGRAREEFENAPDTGFFGKVCGRVFNVIYLYFIVSVLYMIGYLLIIKPIVILLNIVLSLIVLATAFLWTPIALLVHYLFTLLVYNYDYQQGYREERQRQLSQKWFPLLISTLKLVWDVGMLILSFLLIFFTPIASFLLLIVFLLRYILRRLYDRIMYGFIRCCGRSPIKETCAAWKISGPGSARHYFFNLREQDVYILVTAEMEKIQLEIFQQKINQELQKPQLLVHGLLTQTAKKFNLSKMRSFKPRQMREQEFFPDRPGSNVRFMEEQLNLYVLNSKEIILGAVRRNPQYNFFQHLNAKEGDFDEFVIDVWIRIFGSDSVFEPLEKLDQRLEIVQNRQVDEVVKIMSSISKEVKLRRNDELGGQRFIYKSERAKRQTQRKTINADEYLREIDIDQIVTLVLAHTYDGLPSSKQNMQYAVFSNANIQSIFAKNEKYLRGESSSIL